MHRVLLALVVETTLSGALSESAAGQARYRTVVIPAGTMLNLSLSSVVSSNRTALEDPVYARLWRAIVVGGIPVVPAGATVRGRVVDAARPGCVKGGARVGIRFSSVRAADGRHTIRTTDPLCEATGLKERDAGAKGKDALRGRGAVVTARLIAPVAVRVRVP